jgi:hypothetical protein
VAKVQGRQFRGCDPPRTRPAAERRKYKVRALGALVIEHRVAGEMNYA